MIKVEDIIVHMKRNSKDVRAIDLCNALDFYFGKPRYNGGSQRIHKTPWHADSRITIQSDKGKSRAYQVKQALIAIERLDVNHGEHRS